MHSAHMCVLGGKALPRLLCAERANIKRCGAPEVDGRRAALASLPTSTCAVAGRCNCSPEEDGAPAVRATAAAVLATSAVLGLWACSCSRLAAGAVPGREPVGDCSAACCSGPGLCSSRRFRALTLAGLTGTCGFVQGARGTNRVRERPSPAPPERSAPKEGKGHTPGAAGASRRTGPCGRSARCRCAGGVPALLWVMPLAMCCFAVTPAGRPAMGTQHHHPGMQQLGGAPAAMHRPHRLPRGARGPV